MSDTAVGTKRIKTVDFFKGFAIIAIVMIHVITLHPRETAVSVASAWYIEFFYTGLIGFFIVSGYFYKERDWGYVIKRVVKILILIMVCIIVTTTILWLYLNATGYGISVDLYVENLLMQLSGGVDLFQTPSAWGAQPTSACWGTTGYYFLWSFAMTTLLFYAIAKWSLKDDKNTLIAITVLVVIATLYFVFINLTLPMFLQLVPIETAFMLVGAWMGKRKIIHKMEANWKDPTILIAVAISFILGIMLICFFPTNLGLNASIFGEYGGWSVIPFFFINLFCGFVLIYLASLVSRIRYLSDLVCYVGMYSLQILLLSSFFIKMLASINYTLPDDNLVPVMPIWVCVVIGILAIVLCIGTTHLARYIIRKSKSRGQKPSSGDSSA